jgi:hypothetical protein
MLVIVCFGFLSAGISSAYDGDAKAECTKVKQKIRYIQSKMRAGYTRAQGEKMEAQLRKLLTLRKKACR